MPETRISRDQMRLRPQTFKQTAVLLAEKYSQSETANDDATRLIEHLGQCARILENRAGRFTSWPTDAQLMPLCVKRGIQPE